MVIQNITECTGCLRIGVLRRILGPKRERATGEWRKLHNELNDL
jgi:hypothetical protein